jgi:ABC-type transport system involved in multi-copper enzyme maturation permease subunit
MSTATNPVPTATLDTSGTARVPFARLVSVELRKMWDTRAGLWLLGSIVVVTAAFMLIFFFVADSQDRSFENFIGFAATPQGFLLPVLGILLVTQEWGQRTAMVTFALEPSRPRVIAAKVVAALLFGAAAFVAAILTAALFTAVGGSGDGFGDLSVALFALFLLLQLLGIIQGLAYGLLLLNSPAAIVAFFVLPIASSIIFNVVPGLRDVAQWFDLNTAQQPLFDLGTGESLTGEEWANLASATSIWVILPFVLGLVRVMRAELK